jgi:hypothetical protein
MKKFTILFLLVVAYSFSFSQVSSSSKKINLFYEDFETFAIPGSMHGWTQTQTNTMQTWVVGTIGAHGGSQYIRIYPDIALGSQDEWLTTGYIDLTGTVHPVLSFWWSGDRYHSLPPTNNVNFLVHARPNDGAGWTNVFNEEFDTTSWQQFTWKQEIIDLPSSFNNSPSAKIAFQLYAINLGGEFGFDDVVIEDSWMGIEDINKNVKINVYPNPVSNIVYMHAPQKLGQVDIFNVNGAVVLSKFVGTSDGSIDVSGLSEGLYFIGATTPEGYLKSRINIVR